MNSFGADDNASSEGEAMDGQLDFGNPQNLGEGISGEENELGTQSDSQETPSYKSVSSRLGYLGARTKNFASRNFNFKRISGLMSSGLKYTFKYGMGLTGGLLGAAAGIASGNPGDVLKYSTGGAYAGSSIGQGVGNRLQSGIENQIQKQKGLHEDAIKRQYGEETYERMQNAKMDEKFIKDKEKRKLYSTHFNNAKGEELKKIMEQAKKYREYGITDDTLIMRAMDLNANNRADKRSIAAAKMAQSAKSEKDLEQMMKRFAKAGASKTQQEQMEKRIRAINRETLN